MNPQFPIYIVSKGRHETRLTAKALELLNVDYSIVVEEQEYLRYARVIKHSRILVLDKQYQRDYDTFDDLADSKSKGPGAARNFAWEHSIACGAAFHWVMDDNIREFIRVNKNAKVRVRDATIFACMEDFVLRYTNVGMAGPNYRGFFNARCASVPPYYLNTRIYSCNLIRNDTMLRWRGRYNEDTDLSLRMLKANWCTILFNAFLQDKLRTQVVKGGCTDDFYAVEGTGPKSRMLVKMHPDVARLTERFQRVHHYVDYKRFRRLRLQLRDDVKLTNDVDEYGMAIVRVKT
jgi:hypothetical protein